MMARMCKEELLEGDTCTMYILDFSLEKLVTVPAKIYLQRKSAAITPFFGTITKQSSLANSSLFETTTCKMYMHKIMLMMMVLMMLLLILLMLMVRTMILQSTQELQISGSNYFSINQAKACFGFLKYLKCLHKIQIHNSLFTQR